MKKPTLLRFFNREVAKKLARASIPAILSPVLLYLVDVGLMGGDMADGAAHGITTIAINAIDLFL